MTQEARAVENLAADALADWTATLPRFERGDVLAALAVAFMMMAFSAWRINASEAATLVNNCIFGADTDTYSRWLNEGNYLGLGVKKHTLSVLLIAALAAPLAWAGVTHALAATIAMAAVWGAVAAIAFFYFRRSGLSRPGALSVLMLALCSFGLATHSGIIETYGVTLLMIGIACLILPAVGRACGRHPVAGATIAGLTGSGLAFANAPSAAFILVYLVSLPNSRQFEDQRKWVMCVAVPFAFILFAVVAPVLAAEGAAGATWHRDYLERYARPDNLMSATTVGNFMASVVVFSFVAPLEFVQCRFVIAQLLDVVSRPLALAAYLGTVSWIVIGIVSSYKSPRRTEVIGLLSSVACVIIFYLYFNPDEALLYSPQWLLPLFFAASPGFERAALWAGVSAILCAAVNLPPLQDARTFEPGACCPNPPSSMLPREHPEALLQRRLRHEGLP